MVVSLCIQNERNSEKMFQLTAKEQTHKFRIDLLFLYFGCLCRAYSIYLAFFCRKTIRFISISSLINRSNSCFLPSYRNIYRRQTPTQASVKLLFLLLQSTIDFLSRKFHFVLKCPLQMNQKKCFLSLFSFFSDAFPTIQLVQ